MSERRGSSRSQKASSEEIRRMFFSCNRRELVVQAAIWWYDHVPPPDVVNGLMQEIDQGNIPAVYERFLYKEIRPAVLITNNDPLPVQDKEVIDGLGIAIKQLKRAF